jgi:hypothetical protein
MTDRSYSKLSGIAVTLSVMTVLVLSPLMTLWLFHPDGRLIGVPPHLRYMVDLELSQLEPLLISSAALWYSLVYRGVQSRLLVVIAIMAIHMFVAFWLISIRGEGVARWFS